MFIYQFINPINNKSYIGKWQGTINTLYNRYNKYQNNKSYFANVLNKYGINNLYFRIIKDNINNKNELANLEKYFITLYDTIKYGYNLTNGGEGGNGGANKGKIFGPHSNEVKLKISINSIGKHDHHKNKNPMFGRKHKHSTKQKISMIHIGSKHTIETKNKISKANIGTNNPRYKILNNEIKSKIYNLYKLNFSINKIANICGLSRKKIKFELANM